jgi:hypothetical protein
VCDAENTALPNGGVPRMVVVHCDGS